MTRRVICVLSIALACLPLTADEAEEKAFDEPMTPGSLGSAVPRRGGA